MTIRVLVVDGHEMFVEALGQALDAHDDLDVVAVATSSDVGLRDARARRPDVVVLDHRLPDADALETAGSLLREHPELRVVMLNGVADEDEIAAALEAGCTGYVTKLQPLRDVAEAVRAVHRGEAVLPPSLLGRVLPRLRQERAADRDELTPRELEVLGLVAEGLSNRAIADRLFLSVHTVRNHVRNLLAKLGAHSKLEAVAASRRNGILAF